MAFVKLDCGFLDSSLWVDREARELFITALLMAVPHELKEPAAQIEVRTLAETGFVVPPGWYGFIAAAGAGIVRRAGMEAEAGMAALERLGAPEPESRTPDFDGRRLVRIAGGYIALNYDHYRQRDYTAKERMKRYRASKIKPKKPGKTAAQIRGEAESRERRYVAAVGNGDEALADRIAADGLPGR